MDTTTTVYTYDGKTNASSSVPLYPGVNINSTNDLSKLSITTVGFAPNSNTATYNTTFNSANQPVTTAIDITMILSGVTSTETETVSLFYQ